MEKPRIQSTEEVLIDDITNSIIPRMGARRGKNVPLTQTEVSQRFSRITIWTKKGEEQEFLEQLGRQIEGLDGEFASEVADLVYYSLQPNCPEDKAAYANFWIEFLGIPKKVALEFCLIKYETRLAYGDNPNHKEIENRNLDYFIQKSYPELKSLWANPQTD